LKRWRRKERERKIFEGENLGVTTNLCIGIWIPEKKEKTESYVLCFYWILCGFYNCNLFIRSAVTIYIQSAIKHRSIQIGCSTFMKYGHRHRTPDTIQTLIHR
jgi:hypothetical protein